MDFRLGDEAESLRKEVRAFIADHLTDEMREEMERTGTHHYPEFARAMGERGWVAPAWPREEGGSAMGVLEQQVLVGEMQRAKAPVDGILTMMLVADTLRVWGTDEQKARVLPAAAKGEVLIALGYSEADAGSDVAAARTRAMRDGDEWVIDGEKMFTSLAHVAEYVFLLTRTTSEGRKHKGLTMFLVPLDTPGITVSEVKTLGGERTNITSYDGVRVPDSARVGEVNGGWAVMGTALELEHANGFSTEMDRALEVAVEAASAPAVHGGGRPIDDPLVRTRLAEIAIETEVSRLLELRAAWMYEVGRHPVAEGPMAKLYSSEAFARAASEMLEMFGPGGLRRENGLGTTGTGVLEHAFRHSQVTRIYAGTSEIQRSLIAERGLGLPRTRSAG